MRELPHLVQLQEKYPNDVHTISLNLDLNEGQLSDELQGKVKDMLSRLKISSQNGISSATKDEVLEKYGAFGLPAVLIFDTSGKLSQAIDSDVDYSKTITPAVEALLQAKATP